MNIYITLHIPKGVDLVQRMNDLEDFHVELCARAEDRRRQLDATTEAAQRFQTSYTDVMRTLQDLQEAFNAQDPTGIAVNTINEQIAELDVGFLFRILVRLFYASMIVHNEF